ncbi:alkyl sulfatase dimerization domain-containing protein [Streptomyces uncialis]|uniref:alkyl sulfatase dimerization domain-containing protein n=1 Tax=Streptomyces uncialis TaxID=1048205 RepID=UPI00386F108F|nr:MBL fold metallo-hydrolase [Streptomyces uncialis]
MNDLMRYAEQVWTGAESLGAYFSGALRKEGLRPVADDVWMWPATGNVYVFRSSDGLLLFDSGGRQTARDLHTAVRALTKDPVHSIIYSHGHVDHVLGTTPFDEEGARTGNTAPRVIAHDAVQRRFDRYVLTAGYNSVINRRQFRVPKMTWPTVFRHPDQTYTDREDLRVGEVEVHLRHGRGETDDATMAWFPDTRILCCGDFYAWNAPNAGNPQKVQRYVAEWAQALRWMANLGAELLLPGHGVPIVGSDRIEETLVASAMFLEKLHDQVLALMNQGASLDEVLRGVTPDQDLLSKPYLRPTYDEPEFIVRNLWRYYGGWYDGDPSALRPAAKAELACEIAELAGGALVLARRASALADRGEHRLAGHLAELAAMCASVTDPGYAEIHAARARVFTALEESSGSFMARSVYSWTAAQSRSLAAGGDGEQEMSGERWAP